MPEKKNLKTPICKCHKVMNKTGRHNLSTTCTNGDFASALSNNDHALISHTLLERSILYSIFVFTHARIDIICTPFKHEYRIEKASGVSLVLETTIAMLAFILTIFKLFHMEL